MEEKPSRETLDQWHNDPANWRMGFFYYNKKDKRIFPPKRTYLGWTINFANPYSILAMVVLVAVLIIAQRLLVRYF
jgi:uncharacterized membrane protein